MNEEPLGGGVEICDPHHHLWEYPQSVYLMDELRADAAAHRVARTVFVECGSKYRTDGPEELRPVGETEWVASLAAGGRSFAAGIVGFADLTLGAAVEGVLDAHVAAADGRFRGIRHASASDAADDIRPSHTNPPPGLLGHPAFRDGFAALGAAGLTFDAWLYFPQLPELVDLARAHPEVTIVLDHLGGPLGIGPYAGRWDELRVVWRASMQEVSACENVVVKLGGIGMPIYGMDWHRRSDPQSADVVGSEEVAERWGPDIRWCIEQFGVDRCMFESNFPVDRRSFSYTVCWNAFLRMTAGASDTERQALFHDTATRVYGLTRT